MSYPDHIGYILGFAGYLPGIAGKAEAMSDKNIVGEVLNSLRSLKEEHISTWIYNFADELVALLTKSLLDILEDFLT